MSREKQDSPGPRDTTLARMVTAALESQTAAASAACPDADVLAAYADHALEAEETTRCESHFADCARCQKILAVLTVSAEDPLTQQEIARLGQLVGKVAVPIEPETPAPQAAMPAARPKVAGPARHHAPWRWVIPAFGAAAAAALWFALRPTAPSLAPATQIMAEKTAVPPPPGQQSQMAQANMPPPAAPAAAAPLSARNAPAPSPTQEKEARSLDSETSSAASAPTKQHKDALRDESRVGALNEDKKIAPPAQALETDQTAPAVPSPMPRQTTQSVTVTGGNPQVETQSGAVGGGGPAPPPSVTQHVVVEPQAPQPTSSAVGGQLSADNAVKALPLAGRNAMAAMAKAAPAPLVFGTPNRGIEWRIDAGGRIERSTDQGRTWQPQSSGVTSDLLAGAAVSDKIAWIVGRADVILRTTDGEHWQRASSPPAPPINGPVNSPANNRVDAIASPPDWSGVEARDALHATIVSAAGRRYATSDGGRTWAPQP